MLRNFHTKRVIMEIVMMKIFNNCLVGRLNSNYFSFKWKFQPLLTFCLFNNYLDKYLSKNFPKTFNELILTPYSYPKQLTAPRVMILTKYTVVCNMPFLMYTFFIFLTLHLLGENNYVLKVWNKNDYAMLLNLRDHKFQWRQMGLKFQPFCI